MAFRRSAGYGVNHGLRYVFADHLASTSVLVNGAGKLIWNERFYPPVGGGVRYHWDSDSGTKPLQTPYRYTGQRHETAILLYDYDARYYDMRRGRFVQPDTIVPNPGDPQSLNRYAYSNNNPLKYTDPTGHWAETVWDIANVGWDIAEVKRDPSLLNWGALVVDLVAVIVPTVPGGVGLIARGGKAAKAGVELATHGDEAVDALRAADRVIDAARAASSFQDLTHAADYGIDSVRELKKLTLGEGVDIHHVIEQRFANTLGTQETCWV